MIQGIALAAAICAQAWCWSVSPDTPVCPAAEQKEACECGDLLFWPPVYSATGYEVERCWAGSRYRAEFKRVRWCELVPVGGTKWEIDGEWRPRLDKALVRYRVRAMRGELRSEWSEPAYYKRGYCE